MEEQEKFYESSNGTLTKMSMVETTHLINSLAKQYREIYNSQTKDEFDKYISKINDVDEELTKRLGKFANEKFNGGK
jgi:hypothetical protein